jgi:hypothetical protein
MKALTPQLGQPFVYILGVDHMAGAGGNILQDAQEDRHYV